MIKFRIYFDKDKETQWINKMAQKGFAMTGFFAGFYEFERCQPGEYIYQVDFSEKFCSVSENYREFMAEMNVEIVQIWGFWVILRKKASDGEFLLYTDVDSNIAHYTKIRNFFKAAGIIESLLFLMETILIAMAPEEVISFAHILLLLFIALIIGVFLRMSTVTNGIIAELKERKGEPVSDKCYKNGLAHPIVLIGLFLNCAALLFLPEGTTIRSLLQFAAVLLMITGFCLSKHMFMKQS